MVKNIEIFKRFLIETMKLSVDEDCQFIFLDKKLAKENYKNIGENIIVNYDITNHFIYNDNIKICIKHFAYFKEMFYNNRELMKNDG